MEGLEGWWENVKESSGGVGVDICFFLVVMGSLRVWNRKCLEVVGVVYIYLWGFYVFNDVNIYVY